MSQREMNHLLDKLRIATEAVMETAPNLSLVFLLTSGGGCDALNATCSKAEAAGALCHALQAMELETIGAN